MTDYTVIVLSKDAEKLSVCLPAVRRDGNPDVVVVYDTAEPIYQCPVLEHEYAANYKATWVRGGIGPFVFSKSVNLGMSIAPPKNGIVLLNDDAILLRGTLDDLMLRAVNLNGIVSAAVRGDVNNPEQVSIPYPTTYAQNYGLRMLQKGYLAFVCVAIPRVIIDAVGLLDERFTTYGGEDIDYCYRTQQAGFPLAVYDGCVVDHGNLFKSTFRVPGNMPDLGPGYRMLEEKWGRKFD